MNHDDAPPSPFSAPSAPPSLRQRLAQPRPLLAPGVYDALSALLAERAGFEALYLSGASVAYTQLGRSDVGLTTATEVADVLARITERVRTPIIVDADTGFGNALNVQRTVRLLERMGASGIQLEDQASPKRCGHLAGKRLVSTGEMLGKLHAALDVRADADTVIVARTDAVAVEGFAAGLARAQAYLDAGADVLFIESLRTPEEFAHVGRELGSRVPLLANMVEGGSSPLFSIDELGDMGFRLAIFPGAMVRVLAHAARDYLATLKRDGSTRRMLDRMLDFQGINAVVGTDALLAQGRDYER